MYAKPKTVNIFYRFETTQFNSTLESAVDQLTINLKILKNITTTTKQINTYNKFVTLSTVSWNSIQGFKQICAVKLFTALFKKNDCNFPPTMRSIHIWSFKDFIYTLKSITVTYNSDGPGVTKIFYISIFICSTVYTLTFSVVTTPLRMNHRFQHVHG